MEFRTIQVSQESGIATITLNRPERRNAISYELIDELLAALDELEKSASRVIVLTGAGRVFCAGMDLEELKSLAGKTHAENIKDSSRVAALFRRIYDFPKPTIAAVNGSAVAGGAGIATMCDFTVAAANARFAYSEVRIGFIPAIVSAILVWQVGHKVARDLLLSGRQFDANEAQRYGLVCEVTEADELMPRAYELARRLLENSPASLRDTKKLLNGFIATQLDMQISQAIEANAASRETDDFREGVASFLEKRKPNWSKK